MIEGVIAIFSSSGVAGITGLVAGFLAKLEERKMKAIEFQHEETMAEFSRDEMLAEQAHELHMADKELALADLGIQRAQTEGDIAVEVQEVEAFTESQKDNKMNGANDGFLRWVRPVIAIYLLILSTYISTRVFVLTSGLEALSDAELKELVVMVIDYVFYLTTMAVGWFFGARGTSRK